MNIESAIVLTILAALAILVGFGWFIYKAIRSGFKSKSVIIITVILGISALLITLSNFKEELLFSKKDAIQYVEEQGIELIDKFKIDNVTEMSTIENGGYVNRSFTLIISERDKKNAISEIKNSDNFHTGHNAREQAGYRLDHRYSGPKVIQNYETEGGFWREFFKPINQEGTAPTNRSVYIYKMGNKLIFQDKSY